MARGRKAQKKAQKKVAKKPKCTRLDAWARGQIVVLAKRGVKAPEISKLVTKADGKTHPTPRDVRDTVGKREGDPDWRGENPPEPRGNSVIDDETCKQVLTLVFRKAKQS